MMASRPSLGLIYNIHRAPLTTSLRLQPSSIRALHRSRTCFSPTSNATLQPDRLATDNEFHKALDGNKKWAQKVQADEPDFLPTCAKGQAPPILWLGCADSRVPETTILGCKPGDVFTHRNIANIINSTDISLLSIVQFAVFHLKVKHIVVCGHTSCGGVAASLANAKLDILDIWLQPLRALREKHHDELESMDASKRGTFLAEKNVQAGVENLKRIPTVIDAMRERGVQVHGVIYNLATGVLEEVECGEESPNANKRVTVFERK